MFLPHKDYCHTHMHTHTHTHTLSVYTQMQSPRKATILSGDGMKLEVEIEKEKKTLTTMRSKKTEAALWPLCAGRRAPFVFVECWSRSSLEQQSCCLWPDTHERFPPAWRWRPGRQFELGHRRPLQIVKHRSSWTDDLHTTTKYTK